MKTTFSTLLFVLAAGLTASAQLTRTADSLEARLEGALQELAELRQQIEREKIPLAVRRDELELEVANLRQAAAEAQRRVDIQAVSLTQLEDRVDGLVNNESFLISNLNDYRQRFNSQLHPAERDRFTEEMDQAREADANPNLPAGDKLRENLDIVFAAVDRLEQGIGGYTSTGNIFDLNNQQLPGRFAFLGPISVFTSNDGAFSGIDIGTETPQLYVGRFNAEAQGAINSLTQGEAALVPFDTTGGKAIDFETTKKGFYDHWKAGGWVIIIIAALLVMALLMVLYKLIQLSGIRSITQRDIDTIVEKVNAGDQQGAIQFANSRKGPTGELLQAAAEHAHEDREVLEESLYEKIIRAQPKIESLLPLIAAVAATAPLLGLLGTVTGMIRTFEVITVVGTGDARSLSGGISEALVTTEGGLWTAITTLIAHAILSFMAKRKVASLEQAAVTFVNAMGEASNRREDVA